MPLHPAPGNKPDIVCKYGDFEMIVEVTLSSGQRQYEMEGEPVARHLGIHKKNNEKQSYCFFIAPSLNQATLAHFFALHKTEILFYGGRSEIIPLQLSDFKKMLQKAFASEPRPTAVNLRDFMTTSSSAALVADDENDWYQRISSCVDNWLQ
jgi:hypothetical protein